MHTTTNNNNLSPFLKFFFLHSLPLPCFSSSYHYQPLNFTLGSGEYAEITTIDPSSKTTQSCLKDACQAKLKYSYYYNDFVGRRRNMDGSLYNFQTDNDESVFLNSNMPDDSCKHFDANELTVRKSNHWCYVGGISDRPRTFFAAVELGNTAGSACPDGMKLRVKKHKYVDIKSTNNIQNQGVQCVDLSSTPGLVGRTLQPLSKTAPYINVTQMYRRKWPNASNIRWWVQSKEVKTGTNINVGNQCDGDMSKDTCKNTKPADRKTFCNFTYSTTSFPGNFYRPGQLIGFKEPYKCAANQPNPGTTDCTIDTCTKYWGEMTTFFGKVAPNNKGYTDGTIASPVSVFGSATISQFGRNSGLSWFTVDTNSFQGQPGWTIHQVCPSSGTTIVHVPTKLETDWYGTARKRFCLFVCLFFFLLDRVLLLICLSVFAFCFFFFPKISPHNSATLFKFLLPFFFFCSKHSFPDRPQDYAQWCQYARTNPP